MLKKMKVLMIMVSLFLVLLSACATPNNLSEGNPEVSGNYANEENVFAAKELLEKNLQYAQEENIEGYLSTISTEAHADTREAMTIFFDTHTVSHTLLAFEVVEEYENELVVKSRQKTMGADDTGETEYRNHIAEVLHVFEKIEGEWKIIESSVTDINFLE